jgi:cytochrome c-type biogenesis protein CcmH
VEEGMTDAEIKDFLVTRYGDFVLYRPQFRATTALLWLAPFLLVVIGGIAFVVVLKRRATLPKEIDAPLMND